MPRTGQRGAPRGLQPGDDLRAHRRRDDRLAEAAAGAVQSVNLAEYRKRLEDSFVLKDMRKYQKIPDLLHGNRQFLDLYPRIVSKVAQTWLRVDGKAKRRRKRRSSKSVRKQRGLLAWSPTGCDSRGHGDNRRHQ